MKKISKIFSFLLIITTIFSNIVTVNAQSLTDTLFQDDNYKFWVAIYTRDNSHMVATQESMIRRASDNLPVYCIQPHIQFINGSSVNGIVNDRDMLNLSNLSSEKLNRIKLIAYYGYGYEGHSDANWYYATQLLIWSITNPGYVYAISDGDRTLTPSNRYDGYYAEINALVDNHVTVPSFNARRLEMKAGETITLSDTNNVLTKFYESYEDDHISATVNGNNTLTVHAKTSFDGAINLDVKTNENVPLLYDGATQLVLSKGDPAYKTAFLNIYATTEVTGSKVYGSTVDGIYRPEKNAKFEIYNTETEKLVTTVTTDEDGKFVCNLGIGSYRITQVSGKDKYNFVNDYILKIDGSSAKEVIYFKNELIVNDLEFNKVDSETGNPLAGATIEIYDAETDKLVFTGESNKNGQIIVKNLSYGKYYIKETKAPENYEINSEKIYFEVTKTGETIKVEMKDKKIEIKQEIEEPTVDVPNTGISDSKVLNVIGIIFMILGVGYIIYDKKKKK